MQRDSYPLFISEELGLFMIAEDLPNLGFVQVPPITFQRLNSLALATLFRVPDASLIRLSGPPKDEAE